ncbi:MAG: hypothetical protein H7641_14705 [Candidatus Heimdallarchaeota archaeon]|nr:hypothetical protein [Candidatus Heimdallarchaeota archaeon]MCK4878812.1 hypothetical protein [Candidatus Heimdallarchaeota archaeon]
MTVEKKETKINISNDKLIIRPIFFRIAVILLIPAAITFVVRTIYTEVPILRFNITGGIIATLSLFHTIFTIYNYRTRDEKSLSKIELILTLVFDILLMIGGLAAATIYIGPM